MSVTWSVILNEACWELHGPTERPAELVSLSFSSEIPVAQRASNAAEALLEMGYQQEPVDLILPSSWCLCAEISTEDLDRINRRQSMAFRLEEHLPLAAEEIVADYIPLDKTHALGVACPLALLRELIDALNAHDILVGGVFPAAILVGDALAEEYSSADAMLLAWREGASQQMAFDWIELTSSQPERWHWLAGDEIAVKERLSTLGNAVKGEEATVVLVGTEAVFTEQLTSLDIPVRFHRVGAQPEQLAVERADAIGARVVPPRINFRRDELAPPSVLNASRKGLAVLALSLTLLLLGLTGLLAWRASQYAALASQYNAEQATVFRKAFPSQRLPVDIRRRLESQQKKLFGLGGLARSQEDSAEETSVSALLQLYDILSQLPTRQPYQIQEIRIGPKDVRLEGQARNHAEAEQLGILLRNGGRYEVESLGTKALPDRGVRFMFSAKLKESKP